MKYIVAISLMISCFSCRKYYDVQLPDTTWPLFETAGNLLLDSTSKTKIEGVYSINGGTADFGNLAALKWSYTANGSDTVFHLSFFCEKNVAYFICEGKRQDSAILLNGYWRKMATTEAGRARLMITPTNGGTSLLDTTHSINQSITITGVYGRGSDVPAIPISFLYNRPLYQGPPMELVVHRGGGQTADLLPASENSTQIIQLASQFGATGIEIDVRLTKDGVPILFHDADLSERLIQKNGMVGPIEDYTYAQLETLVRLIRGGEHIPTLREALETVVYKTPLDFVWMDTKFHGPLDQIHALQQEFMDDAKALGKNLTIYIGIPDTQVEDNFMALPEYANIPSVCELSPDVVEKVNARIWGPRWTLGLQNDQVAQMHAEGRKAFIWTLDLPENMYIYMTQGHWDGILTDYPSALAFLYYVRP